MVELSSQLAVCGGVGLRKIGRPYDRASHRQFDVVEQPTGVIDALLGHEKLGTDAVLLAAQQIHGHCAAVVGVEQFLALRREGSDAPFLHALFAASSLAGAGEVFTNDAFEFLAPLRSHPNALPEVFDNLLQNVDLDRLLPAGSAVSASTEAEEIDVDAAVTLGVGDRQSGAADAAMDGAFEVVLVTPVALARHAVQREHFLHAVEDLGRDELLVLALVFDTVVGHDAHVVGVRQDPSYQRRVKWL